MNLLKAIEALIEQQYPSPSGWCDVDIYSTNRKLSKNILDIVIEKVEGIPRNDKGYKSLGLTNLEIFRNGYTSACANIMAKLRGE